MDCNEMPPVIGIRNKFAQCVFVVILLIFFALAGRLYYINYKHGKELMAKVNRQQQAFRPIPAVRGTIFDRRGRILAGTKIVSSLFADPAIIEDKTFLAETVSAILQEDSETLLNKLDRNPESRFVWLSRDLNEQALETFNQLGFRTTLRGLGIMTEPRRVYTSGTLAGHVLGFVDIDGKGQEGIERRYDDLLAGKNGFERYMQDAAKRKIWMIKSDCRSPVNGQHVILSIDSVIQQFTQKYLAAACQQYKSESGVAVVMDVKTGDILALASYPEVDPNKFGKTPPAHRRNRAIIDPYEPGSIFKPFIASHALQDGVTHLGDIINCEGGSWTVGRRTLHDAHGYGDLTFEQVVQKSSNIGMAKLGQRLGNDRLYFAVRSFGFGKRTGIDLTGEDNGIVIPFKRWTSFSTLSVPMGQEIACTSLQLVRAFGAIANQGKLVRPRLFRAAIDEQGNITKERSDAEVVNEAMKPEFAKIMVENVLRGVCTVGTGKKADIPGYQVFGKTGTAQIARSSGRGKGHYEAGAYVGSFLGGAPASDPQIVVIVSIRRPVKSLGYYGGTVAAPAVREIIKSYFEYMHIPPFETADPNAAAVEGAGGD